LPNPLTVGFDGLGEIIGAIFVCELCNDRDRLVGFGFGRYLGDIDDNLGMEDFGLMVKCTPERGHNALFFI